MGIIKRGENVITYSVNKAINNNLYISVQNGEVVVKAPWYFSRNQIQEIVEEKRQWIIKKLKEYEDLSSRKDDFLKRKAVVILGNTYDLKVIYRNVKVPELNLERKVIKIVFPSKYRKVNNKEMIQRSIEKLYCTIAEKEIERAMEKTRLILGFAPEDYEIKRMNDKLGMCSEDKKITINPDIVMYDREVIDYVVLHEFAHLKYKIHAKGFMKLLEQNMKNYKECEKKLGQMNY